MGINYHQLGGGKRLSEIIFAGSHDASITNGGKAVQTQDLDIGKQANAGIRLFDLRILAQGGKNGASLVGYHGKGKSTSNVQLQSSHAKDDYSVNVSSGMKYGVTGLKLSNMLKQAKSFVTRGNSKEFLILKFDKCTNYQLIADYCINILGSSIFVDQGKDFGRLTLDEVSRKVICVFNDKALKDITQGAKDGILGFRSLKAKKGPAKAYTIGYKGLQYFGKGGTSAGAFWKTNKSKMSENFKKQKKLMLQMANADDLQSPYVLGMMYWTATGSLSSIKSRNNLLWSKNTGVNKMDELWRCGLEASIDHQLSLDKILKRKSNQKMRMKAFFPNIIMIDFASADKCDTIFSLNKVKDDRLEKAYNQFKELS
ncbi:MAG: hypothetical protein DIZ80_00290 [endosymbiont of Galathealinum brachiosum]|uniref:Uncharacterized protein n=1 Tax=endosymbiont of Galathealinum brachiosum TaxID=2200906 RepID=A0A370DN06_9GAMM|nr:MAG: hypothetical protein DIZ80_00290 [endosymbiont of Galathealinum brachiosum]